MGPLLAHLSDAPVERVSIDRAHALLIAGLLVSAKPKHVLELGIGSGLITRTVALALRYNGAGKVTSVDNYVDWHGKRPSLVDELASLPEVSLECEDELEFLQRSADQVFDFLISDANHHGTWFEEHLRVTKPGGILCFHDTNNPEFPALHHVANVMSRQGKYCKQFAMNSRPDERCDRGLMITFA